MSEPKFTPGPWIVGKDAPEVNYQSEDRLPDGWQTITGRSPPFAFGRCVAHVAGGNDARLIAASPDLYAALNHVLARYVSLANSGDCGFWNPEEEDEVIAARAALAKARGETP